jgi:hypothetical protein
VEPILSNQRTQQIIAAVDHIEEIDDADQLARLLVVPPADRVRAAA